MSLRNRTIRVAAVQASAAFLDLRGTLERVEAWTARAAAQGAAIIAFPETFVPGYPAYLDYCPKATLWGDPAAKEVFARLHENAVEVPGPAADRLAALARKHGVTLVVGVHERAGRSLFNSLLFYGPDGTLLNRHRKLTPTYTERLIWGMGDPGGLRAIPVPLGGVGAAGGAQAPSARARLGGLVCWEHWMPLARQALHDAGEEIHVAAWPAVNETHHIASRHYAFEGRCFVIAVGSILRAGDLPPELPLIPERAGNPGRLLLNGGSAIIAPTGRFLAGPVTDEESVVVADCDLRETVREAMTLDVSGHYSRPDVFEFRVRSGAAPKPARPAAGRKRTAAGRKRTAAGSRRAAAGSKRAAVGSKPAAVRPARATRSRKGKR